MWSVGCLFAASNPTRTLVSLSLLATSRAALRFLSLSTTVGATGPGVLFRATLVHSPTTICIGEPTPFFQPPCNHGGCGNTLCKGPAHLGFDILRGWPRLRPQRRLQHEYGCVKWRLAIPGPTIAIKHQASSTHT